MECKCVVHVREGKWIAQLHCGTTNKTSKTIELIPEIALFVSLDPTRNEGTVDRS
jgi:hypothetical protein